MLDLLSPVNDVFRRDRDVADTTILDPTEADALLAGEWVTLDSSEKLVRVGASTVPDCWQVFSPKGDYSAQAIGKVTTLFLHEYEAETDVFEGTPAVGTELTVKELSDPLGDGVDRPGLTTAAAGEFVHAIVSKTAANNNGKVRYTRVSPFYKHA
jgi:hypothetical protein